MATVDFRGRTVLVTGSGRGLGRDFALELARRGARVVVNDIGTDEHGAPTAHAVAAEIAAAGGAAVASTDSITDPDGAAAVVAAAIDAFGSLDALINNAGIVAGAPFAEHPVETARALLDVHVLGAFMVTQHAFRHMAERGYGRIVSVSSNAGVLGMPRMSMYGAAKAALAGLTNVVALEGEPHGVLANALLPMASTAKSSRSGASRQIAETLGDLYPRMSAPFVTPMAVYLASEACTSSQGMYSAICGRYARMSVAVTDGWFSGDEQPPTADRIAERIDAIEDRATAAYPRSLDEEIRLVRAAAER